MTCTAALANETVWFDKYKCDDAEQQYYERIHKLQWIKSSSEVTPKTPAVAPKMEEKAQVKLEPAAAKPALVPPTAAQPSPVVVQPPLVPTVAPQPAQVPTVAPQPAQVPPATIPPVAVQPIAIQPPAEVLPKGEEKENAEKEVEVKKSKKSKKNKNKKNQQSAEMKGAAPPPQQQPAEAKKAATPIDGKEPQRKAEAKKEPQQQKVEVKKEQQQQQPPQQQQQQQQQQPPPPPKEKVETKKEQQQQQKAETKKEQAPPHEGKKGKNKDKEAKKGNQGSSAGKGSLVDEIARARQHITNSLHCDGSLLAGGDAADILARLAKLEVENKQLSKVRDDVKNVTALLSKLTLRLEVLEKNQKASGESTHAVPATRPKAPAQKKTQPKEEDDDVDLFGSDDEDDAEKERIKAERLKMYEEKKSKKPALIAKSNIILDVKPWDDETDMKAMEAKVREVACDGLLWGASKLVPLAYGIHKLQISCVIEDEKVGVDWLQENIEANEDLVQSVDVAAFNKV